MPYGRPRRRRRRPQPPQRAPKGAQQRSERAGPGGRRVIRFVPPFPIEVALDCVDQRLAAAGEAGSAGGLCAHPVDRRRRCGGGRRVQAPQFLR